MKRTYYIFQKNKVVFSTKNGTPAPFDQAEIDAFFSYPEPLILQETPTEKGMYIAELSGDHKLPEGYERIALRSLLGWVEDGLFSKWGKAAQLLHWYRSNRYCGSCGSPTKAHPNEMARLCTSCAISHYPAISPCIIVLIYRDDEILLARSPRFPEKMFSTLAGFVEPGETAEETVQREIFEEVQINVKNIRYFRSQPWPFPGQLMLGFFAQYDSGEIKIDGVEICEAHWYRRNSLPQIPAPGTIAGQLIRHHIGKDW